MLAISPVAVRAVLLITMCMYSVCIAAAELAGGIVYRDCDVTIYALMKEREVRPCVP